MVSNKSLEPKRIENNTIVMDEDKFIKAYFHNDFDDVAVYDMYTTVKIKNELYDLELFVIGNHSCSRNWMEKLNPNADFVEWDFTPQGYNSAYNSLTNNLVEEFEEYIIKWE